MCDNDEPRRSVRLATSGETKRYTEVVARQTREIEEGDWQRWMRHLEEMPEHRPTYRDVTFAAAGVAGDSLLAAMGAWAAGAQCWLGIACLLIGGIASAVAYLCFTFNRTLGETVSMSTRALVRDMKDVYGRADRTVELPVLKETET